MPGVRVQPRHAHPSPSAGVTNVRSPTAREGMAPGNRIGAWSVYSISVTAARPIESAGEASPPAVAARAWARTIIVQRAATRTIAPAVQNWPVLFQYGYVRPARIGPITRAMLERPW